MREIILMCDVVTLIAWLGYLKGSMRECWDWWFDVKGQYRLEVRLI
ncbi:hypothetical protein VA7868_02912 [Vibrio aerogenes CECT 7868]|uniref:Uncharacterized protein n=1 Tax=Vibrio aerogenes CECT 7868 TaxID=1216006 RepID=A0A1M5ZLM9_9VIBR|nr:hypothetical protein VA7868_02912 [Vibrio aerogenes CECT 7868]